MSKSLQQIRAVLDDPTADLTAVREAARELVDHVEGLVNQFNQIYQKFNTHTHHFDVTDQGGNQQEIPNLLAATLQKTVEFPTFPIPLKSGSQIRLSRAR